MKPVTANLKILYQSREMWVWYFANVIIIFLIWLPPHPENLQIGRQLLITPLLNLSMVGAAMGRLMADVWQKPMFFCLPRQRETSLKMLLLVGLAICIITFFIMIIIFSWTTVGSLVGPIMLVSFYLMVYWLSVIISIRFYKVVFIIPFFIFYLPNIFDHSGMYYTVENLLLNHLWVSAFVCLMISCLIYYALTMKSLFRSLVAIPWLMLFIGWKNAGSNRYNPSHLIQIPYINRFAGFIDYFFLKRIQANNRSLILPLLWGRVFVIYRSLISNCRMIFFVGLLAFFCALIFINHNRYVDLQPYFFSLFGVLGGHMCLMYGSGILLPISRKGQFFCGITAVTTSIFIMLILASAFVLFSNILSATTNFTSFILFLEPEYIPFNGKYIFFSAMVLPTTAGLLILFQKKSTLSTLSIIGLALFILTANLYINNNGGHMFNLFIIILITVLSFGFYLAILYFHIMKRSLC